MSHTRTYRLLFACPSNTLCRRTVPELNRFTYSLYMAYFDLHELESGALDFWPFFSSTTPYAFTSLLSKDHCCLKNNSASLRNRLLEVIAEKNQTLYQAVPPNARISILTGLRVLGMEFNPVSFYFVYKDDHEVLCVVQEVNNIPWLEQHLYILEPTSGKEDDTGGYREYSACPKVFHVSPFIDMNNISYSSLISRPDTRLRMKIALERDSHSFFIASLQATKCRLSALNILRFQLTHPLQTAKVIGAIMWEAGKLFRRGFTFVPHPNQTETRASKMIAFVVRVATAVYSSLFERPRVDGQ